MKLCRYGSAGAERPGLIDTWGELRDLSGEVGDIGPDMLDPETLQRLRAIDPVDLPLVPHRQRLGACVTGSQHFVAIGLNYADHAAESGMAVPEEPVVFQKWISCIQGPNDDVIIPAGSTTTDWEVELGVVIGTTTFRVDEHEATTRIAGYCLVNDLSEREWQLNHGATWDKGKGFPSFGPIGPWLVTVDEIADPQNLSMWLDVNGRRMQQGNTATMIFPVARIVSYLSQFMRLEPGDIITTGTPPGVGMGQKPMPQYLKVGDVIELGIDFLGSQRQICIAQDAAR